MTGNRLSRRTARSLLIGAAALTTVLAYTTPGAAAPRAVSSGPSASATHAPSALAAVTAAPRLQRGTRVLGALAASTPVTGAVALRLPDPGAVTRFIDDVSNSRSPSFHHYLGRGQFAADFGPRPAVVEAVRHQLSTDGLRVTGVSANHLFVSFSGTAATTEAAFHTGLVRVRLANGAAGQATTAAVRVPGTIARDVQAVIGLDQLVRESNGLEHPGRIHHGVTSSATVPHTSDGGPVACGNALAQQANGALTDQQVATSYGVDPLYGAGDLASGQTIDVYELEPFLTSDLQGFEECYFGADHTSQLTVSSVDGGPGTGPGSGEAALDVEDVAALAPGADIHVFSGPNMDNPFGPLDTWNAIAIADDAGQITSSWGVCETALQEGAPGVEQVENEIFEQTAAQGQTVFSAAGDDGSDDCAAHASSPVAANLSLDDPSSQPYVTSVGGTTILNATEPPVETVWNNGDDGGAGGGGISELWAMQPWQTAVAVAQASSTEPCSNDPSGTADNFHVAGIATTLPSGTLCRETPDVSALADPQTGITIEWDGQWFQIGGTSSSTPMWAAMLAEISGSSGCNGLAHGVGFADPLLYQIAGSSAPNYAAAFSDVTSGNNDNLGVGGAVDWQAGAGYDLASGLGTPRVTDSDGTPGLAAQLCTLAAGTEGTAPPVVTSLSVTSGVVSGGGTLVVNGSNFGASAGSIFFGNVDAVVTNWTSTAVTVDIPAYHPPAGSPAGSAGSADVTVVTAGAAPESSAPKAASTYHYAANSPSGAPVVDYVSAPSGLTAGGNQVTIVGAGLTGATAVHFGDVAATIVSVASDNEMAVTVPASDGTCAVPATQGMCAVAVTVTTGKGVSSSPVTILPAYQGPIVFAPDGSFTAPAGCDCEVVPAPDEYDYASAPTISSVLPAYANENGGTSATITGTGFNLLTFEWANVGAAGLNDSQDFSLEGVTPDSLVVELPGAAADSIGPVATALSVQSSAGLSNVSSFSYAGVPTLSSISKHLAAQADPGTLGVTGAGLTDVTSVVFQLQGPLNFLSSTSTTITNQTDTSLTVAIPQGFTYPADVLLCTATGCTAPDPAVDTLTLAYPGRPVVSSSGPVSGPAHGGTLVTIQGSLDSEVTAVHFGNALATIEFMPELTASGPITVLAPPGRAGSKVDVTISTAGGTLAQPPAPTSAPTSTATFTYTTSTPGAPLDLSVHVGVRSLDATWKAPSNNGGDPVTGYVVVAVSKGHKSVVVHVGASTHDAVVRGLAPRVDWTLTVRATNKIGQGLAATSRPLAPTA